MKRRYMLSAVLLSAAALLLLYLAAGQDNLEKADSISVYLWSNTLYGAYAPYIQAQLPDVDIEFVVGNNDLDFYKFMMEKGALPDIITCRRFSLHDAADLSDHLMDLSTTEEAGAVYESYLQSFVNTDGSVNWLPLCGEVDGFVANCDLFEQYGVALPTDYESFVAACDAFEQVGIRGFAGDFFYDYTCMEILQGLSIPEINSMEGQIWRSLYEDPYEEENGLDSVIWPEAFERMERFIRDARVQPEDVELSYSTNIRMFREGEAAIIRASGANVAAFREQDGINAVMLPYFGENGEQWLLTYPAFQVALNRDLENDRTRRDQALRVLRVMLSEEAQNVLARGSDVISYSQNVQLRLSPELDNLTDLIRQNHLFIRLASNDFFSVSLDVVHRMILGEYDARQAYEAFDAQLRQSTARDEEIAAVFDRTYSTEFHREGGNAAASVMAHTLRACYGSDVLVAPATSFTGAVFAGDYTEEMIGCMIMPNALDAWQCDMTGAQLTEYIVAFVERNGAGYVPFNRSALPIVSGVSLVIRESGDGYALERVLYNGRPIDRDATFRVTCLNPSAFMGRFLIDPELSFVKEKLRVRNEFTAYITGGGRLLEPERYITLR